MREYTTPNEVDVMDTARLPDVVFDNAERRPGIRAFSRKIDGGWKDVTSRDFRDEVVAVAKGLIANGVRTGDRVGLLSRTRYEWTLCDYAIWTAGAVTVPIFETSSEEQIRWIVGDSGTRAIIVETEDHAATVRSAVADLDDGPGADEIWTVDAGGMDELRTHGTSVSDDSVAVRRRSAGADELATIIYTSGTTGLPKGCRLTHRNLLYDARAALASGLDRIFTQEGASILLFLPLAHVLPRVIQVGAVESGVRLGHCPDTNRILDDLASFRPLFVLSVPRVFEKVYNSAARKAAADGKAGIFHAADETAVAYSRSRDSGGPGVRLRLKHALFERLVYGKLRAALGGRASCAVSGGAPLSEHLGHFFRGIGVPVLEGYGMTETAAAVTLNSLETQRVGTVGPPLPGTSVAIADDGEVLTKGPQVLAGYWNNPTATEEAFDADGWLHTGDMGELDSAGFLTITGRKKEILVTAAGKNVVPAPLEEGVRKHPLVSQCVVVGDRRHFVGALVTLDAEGLEAWKHRHGKPAEASVAELCEDSALLTEIQSAVDDANAVVSRAESIRRFRVLSTDFTETSGHLTPSMKVRREAVMRDFADEIEEIYSDEAESARTG